MYSFFEVNRQANPLCDPNSPGIVLSKKQATKPAMKAGLTRSIGIISSKAVTPETHSNIQSIHINPFMPSGLWTLLP